MPEGVRIRPAGYRPWIRRVVFEVPATIVSEIGWQEFLISQIGKPYDYEAIWAFLFNRDWREPDSWICSEFQAAALEVSGIVPRLYLAANKITPVALALAVSAMGAKVVESVGC